MRSRESELQPLIFAVVASFLGSLLLFAFEPYIGKILLPSFGGTPLLWNTCVVFFQVALLGGYLYALAITRSVGIGVQLAIQLVLLGALFFIYPAARHAPNTLGDIGPGVILAGWLSRYVLLPFVALSSLTTLVQHWFVRATERSVDPYSLYAASNAGSLAGLFAYPFFLEPNFSLGEQRVALLSVLAAVIVALTGLGVVALRRSGTTKATTRDAEAEVAPVPRAVWLEIVALTAIPASLLLGVTNYVLTDIASVPLFWIVPLALYLTTFILAFARRQFRHQARLGRVYTLFAIAAVVSLAAETTAPATVLIPMHLITVFIGSFLCHLKVAALAPHPRWLPHYYLAISLGGALGGLVTLLVPPLVTDRFIEYPIAIVLSSLVLAANGVRRSQRQNVLDFALPVLLVVVSALLLRRFLPVLAERFGAAAFLPAAMFVLNGNTRPRVFTTRLTALLIASLFVPSPFGTTLFAERNFYGRVRVTVDLSRTFHRVVHGSTVHGSQQITEMSRCSPTAYYHATGPAGQFLASLAPQSPRRVALVGLGSGALACFARPGDVWDLYELNPVMADVARDTTLFTFLQRSPATKNLILGDARLSIERMSGAPYDVVIVDAFSSDAIPIHLITQEAIAEYARRLEPGGVLLFHISNRFFALRPVLASVAPNVRMSAFVFADSVLSPNDAAVGKYASEWVILTDDLGAKTLTERWVAVPPSPIRVWTDDYSNPLAVLKSFWTQ